MITEIRLENFKSFRELTKIPLKKVTVFIGPNGSGKSTPLQALMLLKQSAFAEGVTTRGIYVDLGDNLGLFSIEGHGLNYKIGVTFQDESRLNGEVDIDVLVKPNAHIDATSFIPEKQTMLKSVMDNIYYVSEWRGFYQSSTDISAVDTNRLFRNPAVADTSSLVASALSRDPKLRRKISDWLKGITDVRIDHALARGGFLPAEGPYVPRQNVLSQLSEEEAINIVNEGFGSNQLVQLLVQLARCPKGSFLAIEEPEAHLHPKAQVALVKVLLERAKEYDLQLVLVTHSEHVLHTILNQVAKGNLTPKDAGLLYFRKEDGVSIIEERVITKRGQVKGGLPDFFEVELEQFSEFVEALSKHK
ncbi:MAG: AAA family ATPase [Chloroflexi bacterium]|nr:AAA family ATPase [Chloroflexota bacterium]